VRPIIKSRLLDALGGPDAIYDAAWEELASVPGIKPQEANLLLNRDMSAADEAISFCLEHGISFLTLQDAQYPECLRNIPDPPVVLYVWGKLPPVDECPTFAIVGTRRATAYGLSAGGPIVRHDAQCLMATPLCARELLLRPVILPLGAHITLRAHGRERRRLQLAIDGQTLLPVTHEAEVEIALASDRVRMILPGPPHFFDTLRKKQVIWNLQDKQE